MPDSEATMNDHRPNEQPRPNRPQTPFQIASGFLIALVIALVLMAFAIRVTL